jgi:flagellar biosynthesis/type III secretory pathway ATPase
MGSEGSFLSMLLLVAVTPHAAAFSSAGVLLRPNRAVANTAGQNIVRAAVFTKPDDYNRRPPTLRSAFFPAPSAVVNAFHASKWSRLDARGLKMTASMTSDTAASVEVPEELPLQVVSQNGRVLTARLEDDMTGTWLLQGRRVELDGGKCSGTVLWQRIPLVFVLLDETTADPVSCSTAIIQPGNATLVVSDSLIGKELDAMGRVLSSSAAAAGAASQERSIFGVATQMADLATISRPMHTGITAVDALTPIGKGQNMLVVGSEELGRRKLALDSVLTQAREGSIVVYVDASGDKLDLLPELTAAGVSEQVVIVRGGAGVPGIGVLAAATGTTIAEHFRAQVCPKPQTLNPKP